MTGNTFAEEFTRFVSADVMRQLSDPLVAAGKLSIKEQNTYISSFVNRVQGNYVTSQRPSCFKELRAVQSPSFKLIASTFCSNSIGTFKQETRNARSLCRTPEFYLWI